jgi:hypothetical protein
MLQLFNRQTEIKPYKEAKGPAFQAGNDYYPFRLYFLKAVYYI